MIKLTQYELDRCSNIFSQVFNAIAPDLDTLEEFDYSNRSCIEMCVDYVYAYALGKEADQDFMSELYTRVGYDNVMDQLEEYIYLG
jgi:hypothetical protein